MMVHRKTREVSHLVRFLYLVLFTAAGIFAHELAHHLLGIPSELSLARNWPLVAVTPEYRDLEIVGTLAGPALNLALGYLGFLLFLAPTPKLAIKQAIGYFGLANLFISGFAAVLNLVVDTLSRTMSNDLQVVSSLLGVNTLILPGVFVILSVLPVWYLWSRSTLFPRTVGAVLLTVGAWFTGGAALMLLDYVLQIRFRIV